MNRRTLKKSHDGSKIDISILSNIVDEGKEKFFPFQQILTIVLFIRTQNKASNKSRLIVSFFKTTFTCLLRNFPAKKAHGSSANRDAKWDQLGTLLPARYKGVRVVLSFLSLSFFFLYPLANFAIAAGKGGLTPLTAHNPVDCQNCQCFSCVGRHACFNHRPPPPPPLRSPPLLFFSSPTRIFSPPRSVFRMEVISTSRVKLAGILLYLKGINVTSSLLYLLEMNERKIC